MSPISSFIIIFKILQLENILKDKGYLECIIRNRLDTEYLTDFDFLLMNLCELNGDLDKLLIDLQAPCLKSLIQRLNSSLDLGKDQKAFSDCWNRIILRFNSLDQKKFRVCFPFLC
jgi:hypothetical protein